MQVHWLVSSSLSVAFTPFGSLLFLPPVFLRALTTFDYFVDLTDDVLSIRQEISIFVDRRVPRRHFRSIDVGNIRERDETFAVGSIDLLYRPVPLKLRLAALSALSDLGWVIGIRMHVRSGIAHERCCSWLVGIGEEGRFRDIPREVCGERNKGSLSTTRSRKKRWQTENTKEDNATETRGDSQVRYFEGSRGGRLLSSLGGSEGRCSLDFPLLDVRELPRS